MGIFKSTDDKLKELGFEKTRQTDGGVTYEKREYGTRRERTFYIHVVEINRKLSGKHLIQSFQKGLNSDKFNNVIGLTYKENKLFLKKMKEMKLN